MSAIVKAVNNGVTSTSKKRANKPLMEKRRRQKMNSLLDFIKQRILVHNQKDPAKYAKMEKVDILELTANHLVNLQEKEQADPEKIFQVACSTILLEIDHVLTELYPVNPEWLKSVMSCITQRVSQSARSKYRQKTKVKATTTTQLIAPLDSASNSDPGELECPKDSRAGEESQNVPIFPPSPDSSRSPSSSPEFSKIFAAPNSKRSSVSPELEGRRTFGFSSTCPPSYFSPTVDTRPLNLTIGQNSPPSRTPLPSPPSSHRPIASRSPQQTSSPVMFNTESILTPPELHLLSHAPCVRAPLGRTYPLPARCPMPTRFFRSPRQQPYPMKKEVAMRYHSETHRADISKNEAVMDLVTRRNGDPHPSIDPFWRPF